MKQWWLAGPVVPLLLVALACGGPAGEADCVPTVEAFHAAAVGFDSELGYTMVNPAWVEDHDLIDFAGEMGNIKRFRQEGAHCSLKEWSGEHGQVHCMIDRQLYEVIVGAVDGGMYVFKVTHEVSGGGRPNAKFH